MACLSTACAFGCSEGGKLPRPPQIETPQDLRAKTQPASEEEWGPEQFDAIFPALPIVDHSDASLKAEGIEELKGLHAVLSQSIGIEVHGETFAPLIRSREIIPVQQTQYISALEPGQQEVEFQFYRGNAVRIAENHWIGSVRVVGLSAGPSENPKFELKSMIKLNGDLIVSANESGSGKRLKLKTRLPQ